MKERRLILASASPRRRELLTRMGLELTLCPVDADERLSGPPDQVVMALACRKARAAAALCPNQPVLGADTLVFCEGETLGKPKDEQDALRMLRLLSGRCNTVYTGVCVIAPDGAEDVRCEASKVFFSEVDDASALRYIRTGEPMDKAGAYAVQGMAGMFVRRVEGSPSNAIGLPMHLVRDMLMRIGFEL